MEIFTIIAILTPIISRLIALAEKKYGAKKGTSKKKWVSKQFVKAWEESVAAGLISGDVAKFPVRALMPLISLLIDSLISVVNQTKKR